MRDLIGMIVIRQDDDSPVPVTGRVTDDDQFSSNPRRTAVWLDEVVPYWGTPQAEPEAGL